VGTRSYPRPRRKRFVIDGASICCLPVITRGGG
jgi:hypothetical protein